jgi:deoxycytidine triphosphate deaminase
MTTHAMPGGSVLSDRTIAAKLTTLLEHADAAHAKHAGYECRPGKLYPTDEKHGGKPIDWTDSSKLEPEEAYSMKPGELLLLRTREKVRMDADLCGLWSQLDRNSRQGLLLVNQTIVPPGYEGFLTCTFVNFANRPIVLRPSLPVARLVFLRLDQPTNQSRIVVEDNDYDQKMSNLALEAPSTFLAIAERSAELKAIVESGTKALTDTKTTLVTTSTSELATAVTTAKGELAKAAEDAKTTFQTDLKGVAKIAGPWALAVIALLAAAQTGANWLSTRFSPDINRIAEERATQLEKKISDQLATFGDKPVFVYSGSAEAKALADRLVTLEKQIEALSTAPPAQGRTGAPGGAAARPGR